jgi:hypothetical protein
METPYEDVLAALTLDTKVNLRFVRTGSRAEGARVALVNVAPLLGASRHGDIGLRWDARPAGSDRARPARPRRARARGALARVYLISTEPPASSMSDLSFSASSRSIPSFTGFGASSTSAFASLRPSPVAARTTLIT